MQYTTLFCYLPNLKVEDWQGTKPFQLYYFFPITSDSMSKPCLSLSFTTSSDFPEKYFMHFACLRSRIMTHDCQIREKEGAHTIILRQLNAFQFFFLSSIDFFLTSHLSFQFFIIHAGFLYFRDDGTEGKRIREEQ